MSSTYLLYILNLNPFSSILILNCLSHNTMNNWARTPVSCKPIGPPLDCSFVWPSNVYKWFSMIKERTTFIASVNILLTASSSGSSDGGNQGLNLLVLSSSRARARPVMVGGRPLLVLRRGQNCSNPAPLNTASDLFSARYSPSSSLFSPSIRIPLV